MRYFKMTGAEPKKEWWRFTLVDETEVEGSKHE